MSGGRAPGGIRSMRGAGRAVRRWLWHLRETIRLRRNPVPSVGTLDEPSFLRRFAVPEVGTRLDRDDVDGARRVLLDHLRARGGWPELPGHFVRQVHDDLGGGSPVDRAERILSGHIPLGRFGEVRFTEEIDWTAGDPSDPRGEATRKLNRHLWWIPIVDAYRHTGDARYARFLDRTVRGWLAANPRPPAKDETSRSWALMEAGIRCTVWTVLYGALVGEPAFSDATRMAVLRALFDHAAFLQRFHNHGNHLLREANGLAVVARALPELDAASSWWATARSRLLRALEEQVNADGTHFELCTAYQLVAIEEFHFALELLRDAADPATEVMERRLSEMLRALATVARPDGSVPMVGDGFLSDAAWRQQARATARLLAIPDPLDDPARRRSSTLPDAGWSVLRRGDVPHDPYLLFVHGPHGGHHGHEDKLSIEVAAFGRPFLVDPGTYTYNVRDRERAFFMSSAAHNTIVVAGTSQIRRWRPENRKARVRSGPHGLWAVDDTLAVACAGYGDGYAPYRLRRPVDSAVVEDVAHRRTVVMVEDAYWLVVDEVVAARPVPLELLFHAAADLETRIEGDTVRVVDASAGTALTLVSAATDFRGPGVLRGVEDPMQGWWSPTRYVKYPADVVVYRWAARPRLDHATVLWPAAAGTAATVTLSATGPNRWTVTGPWGRDELVLGHGGEMAAPTAVAVTLRRRSTDGAMVAESSIDAIA